MIPKILKKGKKGAILFTVTMVMMVLTIIMMATFVVIIAIQKQALNNFTDSQAYITAKSTLDAFIECVRVNPDNDGNGTGDYEDLREMMIGKPNGSGKNMTGGMKYPGTIHSDDQNLTDAVKYVEVTLPVTTEMGELVGKGVKVQRLDRTTFKVSVTAICGPERTETGVLKTGGNSTRTVSRTLSLSPNPSNSIFDSALVSCAGKTQLMNSKTALYGGYVNSSGSPTELNGGTNYIGRVYSKGKLNNKDDSPMDFYLSTTKKSNPSGGDMYALDFLESETGIELSCNVHNIVPTGAEADPQPPVGNPNHPIPYIYASGGSSSKVILGAVSGAVRHIGSDSAPIDIYSEGDVVIKTGTTVHGNVYARGTISGGGTITGDKQPNSSVAFPKPYAVNTYLPVGLFSDPAADTTILNQEYVTNKTSFPGSSAPTIKKCFTHNANPIVLNPAAPIKPEDLGISVMKTGSTTVAVARAGTIASWSPMADGDGALNGQVQIMLGKEDLFIVLPNLPGGTKNYMNGGTIRVYPDTSLYTDPWNHTEEYGNVYLYTAIPSGKKCKLEGNNIVYTDWYGHGTYDHSEQRQYGSKAYNGRNLETNIPSHIFWLLGGNGQFRYESGTNRFNAYIYGRDVNIGGTSWDAPAKGIQFVNTDSFYDNIPMPVGYSASKISPVYIGSSIGARSAVSGGASSIFVEPPSDNIFNAASDQLLKDFTWSVSLYKGV